MKISVRSMAILGGGLALGSVVLLFQNCSPGFEVDAQKLASLQAASVSYVEPKLVLAPVEPLHAANTLTLELAKTIDTKLTVKSLMCSLNGAAAIACPDPLVLKDLADGNYILKILLTDSRGLQAEAEANWMIDTTKPVVTFNVKPGMLSGPMVNFEFTSVDALSGVAKIECALDGETFATCTSPVKKTALAAGPHKFVIRSFDRAGNISVLVESAWTVDLSAPTITISKSPKAFSNSKSADFEFSATATGATVSKYECDLDAAGFTACTSPKNYANLAEGKHTLVVRATNDLNGMTSTLSSMWTVDVTPPTIPVLTTGVTRFTRAADATFMFASTDTGGSGIASYDCSLNGVLAPCVSPKTYTVTEGTYTLQVRAFDMAGNVSNSVNFTWTLDQTPPSVPAISTGTASLTTLTTATFSFTSTDLGGSSLAGYQCILDGGAIQSCTSPKSYEVAEGSHTLQVRALDNAGNISDFGRFTWIVDRTPPDVPTITATQPLITKNSSIQFTYKSADTYSGVASYECYVDNGVPNVCGTSYSTTLGEGPHTFGVRARDGVGNVSAFATYKWTIDQLPPKVIFSKLPVTPETSGTSRFEFTLSDNVATSKNIARCSWSNELGEVSSQMNCDNGVATFTGLKSQIYTFTVVAYDEALNQTIANETWEVAEIAPIVPPSSLSTGFLASCVVTGGAAKCWGQNGGAGASTNDPGSTNIAMTIPGFESGVTQVTTDGWGQVCGIVRGQGVCSTADNTGGMLPARLIPGMESSVVRMASHALGRGCAVVNGSLLCWKSDNANYKYTSAPPATDLNHVGSSSYVGSHFNNECSIRYGAVYCWGNLLVGKQNDQTAERHDGRIRDLTAVSAVAARLGGACALMKGAVYCWGSNDYGELGLGTTTAKTYEPIPRLVPTMASGVTAIASNGYTVCAIKAGDLYCWGVRHDGQMVSDVVEYKRNVAVTTPTLIGGLGAGVKSVAIGSSNTCVVTASGGVMCWGDNIYGQLGNGNEVDSATPVAVIGISGVL